MELNKLYALPTLLDSRFKIRVFSSLAAVIKARQWLAEEFISCQSAIIAEGSDNPPAAKRQHRESSQEEESSLWSSFNSMIETGDETDAAQSESLCTAEVQIESYLKEPNRPRNSNPIVYWEDKKTLYPILAKLAANYLSIPAASVASERLFSTAKHIISDQQNSLNPERGEMLLFINKNLCLFTD